MLPSMSAGMPPSTVQQGPPAPSRLPRATTPCKELSGTWIGTHGSGLSRPERRRYAARNSPRICGGLSGRGKQLPPAGRSFRRPGREAVERSCSLPSIFRYCESRRQVICEPGFYCVGGVRRPCPPGTFGNSSGLWEPSCSGPCDPGDPLAWLCERLEPRAVVGCGQDRRRCRWLIGCVTGFISELSCIPSRESMEHEHSRYRRSLRRAEGHPTPVHYCSPRQLGWSKGAIAPVSRATRIVETIRSCVRRRGDDGKRGGLPGGTRVLSTGIFRAPHREHEALLARHVSWAAIARRRRCA